MSGVSSVVCVGSGWGQVQTPSRPGHLQGPNPDRGTVRGFAAFLFGGVSTGQRPGDKGPRCHNCQERRHQER